MSQDHDHLGVLLTAYADGSLPEEGCAFIEQQLEAHPELRDRLGEIRATQETLRASLPAAPEALSEDRIAAILAQANRRPAPAYKRWRPLILLAAACFVVAIIGAIATPNLLESRVTATAARDAAMRRYEEQGYGAGYSYNTPPPVSAPLSPAPGPVRVSSIPPPPMKRGEKPKEEREMLDPRVVLDGASKSDVPTLITHLDLPDGKSAGEEENDSQVAKGREVAISDTEMGGQGAFLAIGAADGRSKRANHPGMRREALNGRSGFPGPALDQVRQRKEELSNVASVAKEVAFDLNVKLADVEDDLDALSRDGRQAGEGKRKELTRAQTDFKTLVQGLAADREGTVAKQEAGREKSATAQDKIEVRTESLRSYDGLADAKKTGPAPATTPAKPAWGERAADGKERVLLDEVAAVKPAMRRLQEMQKRAAKVGGQNGYAITEDGEALRRSLNKQNEERSGGSQDALQAEAVTRDITGTGIGFIPHVQDDLNGLLGDQGLVRMEQAMKKLGDSTPLAERLLEIFQLEDQTDGGDPIAVPFRLLVDPNLPIHDQPGRQQEYARGHGTPGQAVLNLCTANALQVVPMPGGFEVQAMRRALDPTATFGWSRDDLRNAFGSVPMQAVAEDAQQTFAIDASTSSFSAAQAALAAGHLPDPAQIEPQHLYNAVPVDYPAPSGNEAFQLLAEAGPSPFASGPLASRTALVAIGVVSRKAAEGERMPLDLVVALDASGSMGRPTGLARARAGLAALLPQLDARDRIAVVAFGDVARVVLPALRGDQQQRLGQAIAAVQPAGSTNLADGLSLACQVAGELATPGRACRVLLATDGAALAGDAAPAAEAALQRWRGRGVSLLVVGCADEQYDGAALERLAQKGDGEHLVAASDQQARELFTGRLLPARLAILARDAKAQVTWNPERVAHARLIGFEKRRLTHQQFRDNTVDAGELAQDAQATALFEIVLRDGGSGPLGTAAVRYHDTRLDRVVELSRPLPGGLVAATASPRLRLLACAAELGETMQSGWWRNVRGPSAGRLAAELARLDAPFAQVLAGMERRFRDLERQDAKP